MKILFLYSLAFFITFSTSVFTGNVIGRLHRAAEDPIAICGDPSLS